MKWLKASEWRSTCAVKVTKDNPEVPLSLVWRVVIGFGSFPFPIFLTTYFEATKSLTLVIVSVVFALTVAPIKAISRRKARTESTQVDAARRQELVTPSLELGE